MGTEKLTECKDHCKECEEMRGGCRDRLKLQKAEIARWTDELVSPFPAARSKPRESPQRTAITFRKCDNCRATLEPKYRLATCSGCMGFGIDTPAFCDIEGHHPCKVIGLHPTDTSLRYISVEKTEAAKKVFTI